MPTTWCPPPARAAGGNFFKTYGVKPDNNSGRVFLEPISRVNLLVGPNNSGKSRLLRELATSGSVDFEYDLTRLRQGGAEIEKLLRGLKDVLAEVRATGLMVPVSGRPEVTVAPARILDLAFQATSTSFPALRSLLQDLSSGVVRAQSSTGGDPAARLQNRPGPLKPLIEQSNSLADAFRHLELPMPFKRASNGEASSRTYIPVLRSLRRMKGEPTDNATQAEDGFQRVVIDDHFKGLSKEDHRVIVFTGLGLYDTSLELLRGTFEQREQLQAFEEFLSEVFLDGQRVTIIPRANAPLHIKIGREKERPVSELGDGISSIIVMTFRAFVETAPHLFFIEEPELFLHPGLQRRLLTWMTQHSLHSFFLATHSNHFLDLTADLPNISVFRVTKDPLPNGKGDEVDATFRVQSVGSKDRSLLEVLGVRTSSVFLANKTIWVEGVTERIYLRKWLELVQTGNQLRLEEDIDFAFVEYAGANIVHWCFSEEERGSQVEQRIRVASLCGPGFVVADNDAGKRSALKKELTDQLGLRFYELPVREIENTLSAEFLWRFVREREDNNARTAKGLPALPDAVPFADSDFQTPTVCLGTFVKEQLQRCGGARLQWEASSGTLLPDRKAELREFVRDHFVFDDLVGPAKNLTDALLAFLRDSASET